VLDIGVGLRAVEHRMDIFGKVEPIEPVREAGEQAFGARGAKDAGPFFGVEVGCSRRVGKQCGDGSRTHSAPHRSAIMRRAVAMSG